MYQLYKSFMLVSILIFSLPISCMESEEAENSVMLYSRRQNAVCALIGMSMQNLKQRFQHQAHQNNPSADDRASFAININALGEGMKYISGESMPFRALEPAENPNDNSTEQALPNKLISNCFEKELNESSIISEAYAEQTTLKQLEQLEQTLTELQETKLKEATLLLAKVMEQKLTLKKSIKLLSELIEFIEREPDYNNMFRFFCNDGDPRIWNRTFVSTDIVLKETIKQLTQFAKDFREQSGQGLFNYCPSSCILN